MLGFLLLDDTNLRSYIRTYTKRGCRMRKTRKTRQIRMDDEEWEAFKTLLGAEWLRSKIASAIQHKNRKPTATNTEE
jgi:hypothetical protein